MRLVLLLSAVVAFGMAAPPLFVGPFSREAPGAMPAGWERMELGNETPTTYELVSMDGATVVRAEADNAASGLIRRLDVSTDDFPVLAWRWRVENVIESGTMRRRGGDDNPVRIYVTFDYDPSNLSFADRVRYRALRALGYHDVPLRALCYVWANRADETEMVPNPFSNWVIMIPTQSGPAQVGQWVENRRNVVDDYRAAFGEDPPPISGIAIMTDTDNTGERAVAYYGDIELHRR